MKLRRFTARSMSEALRAVKAALGDDAILLETETGAGGVVVTAAVDDDEAHATPADGALTAEVRRLLGVVRTLVQQARLPATAPAATALARALASQGVDAAIATALVEATLARLEGDDVDALPAAVAASLPRPSRRPPRVRLLVGPPGDGKTTTAAKLAARERDAGRRVVLVAADGFRLGAGTELAAWGRVLDVPVLRATAPGSLAAALARSAMADAVLVDTPGAGPGQNDELGELARLAVEAGPDAGRVLVVSAACGAAAAQAAWDMLGPLAPDACVLSKADAAPGAPWLSLLWRHGVPVTYLALGRGVVDALAPATPAELARRLLDV